MMPTQQLIETIPLHLTVFADESRDRKCPLTGDIWDYFIIGLVKTDNVPELLNDISCVRHNRGEIVSNYQVDIKSKYYEKNNRILHFSELDDADKKFLSERFTDWFLYPNNLKLRVVVCGVNRSKIDESFFGEDVYMGVYNRFFRSALSYAIKQYYGNAEEIHISKIYHEIGEQSYSTVFRNHIFKALKDAFKFDELDVHFIEKDHNINSYANVIQVLDLILGATTFALHSYKNNGASRAEEYKNFIVDRFFEILPRSINESKNKNSHTKHYQKYIVMSFPENPINRVSYGSKNYELRSGFYRKRPIPYFDNVGQLSLFSI